MWAGGVRLVYYSAIASDGRPAIGLMTTGSEWSDPQGRNCNLSTGVETDTDTDTDSDTDTDADTDTDTDTDADTDADTDTDVSTDTLIDTADGERSGCGCGTPGTPAWTGLVLALLARRRTYA